jgi:NADPH:quinone reductase-like Zn-dependent oxidoreductase
MAGSFDAFVVENEDGHFERGVRTLPAATLGDGGVLVNVQYSSLNYKDALAVSPEGKVARISPLIAGIDLAGTVAESSDADLAYGTQVLAHGYDLGPDTDRTASRGVGALPPSPPDR